MSTGQKLNPFDVAKNINEKNGIMDPDELEKSYNPWMMNRIFSMTRDTVLAADEMNKYYHLDKSAQYSFYYSFLSKKKRYGKWQKRHEAKGPVIEALKQKYGYNNREAESACSILTKDQAKELVLEFEIGGSRRKQ